MLLLYKSQLKIVDVFEMAHAKKKMKKVFSHTENVCFML